MFELIFPWIDNLYNKLISFPKEVSYSVLSPILHPQLISDASSKNPIFPSAKIDSILRPAFVTPNRRGKWAFRPAEKSLARGSRGGYPIASRDRLRTAYTDRWDYLILNLAGMAPARIIAIVERTSVAWWAR